MEAYLAMKEEHFNEEEESVVDVFEGAESIDGEKEVSEGDLCDEDGYEWWNEEDENE